MKFKNLVLSALLGSSMTGLAMANTLEKVYIAGAPAFRQASNLSIDTIVHSYTGGGITATSANAVTFPTLASASQNQWLIPNFTAGVDLEINATWSGSSSGIESVASGTIPQKFIPDSTGSVASPSLSVASAGFVNYQPDISLSNTYQETTLFNGTVTFATNASGTTNFTATFAALYRSGALGVEPYQWVASPGFPATNVSSEQLQRLFKNGRLPLSFFTGNSADEPTWVYGLSRDPGSGARIAAVIQPGIGSNTKIKTYQPVVTGGTLDSAGNRVGGTYGAIPLYPAAAIASLNNIYYGPAGNTGYPSFGKADNSGLLQAVTATGAYYTITYLNFADSAEATTASAALPVPAVVLSYNGAPYSTAALQEGKYQFWAYQFLYRDPGLSGNKLSFANLIESQFIPDIAVSGLKVGRTTDGGPLSWLF